MNPDEVEDAIRRKELDTTLKEMGYGMEASCHLPPDPDPLLKEAITRVAENFVSRMGEDAGVIYIGVGTIAGDHSGILREEITGFLFKTGKYQLVDRRAALLEQKLGLRGLSKPESEKPTGKILGVDATVTGRIKDYTSDLEGAWLETFFKIVNVKTGKVIWAGVVEGHAGNPG